MPNPKSTLRSFDDPHAAEVAAQTRLGRRTAAHRDRKIGLAVHMDREEHARLIAVAHHHSVSLTHTLRLLVKQEAEKLWPGRGLPADVDTVHMHEAERRKMHKAATIKRQTDILQRHRNQTQRNRAHLIRDAKNAKANLDEYESERLERKVAEEQKQRQITETQLNIKQSYQADSDEIDHALETEEAKLGRPLKEAEKFAIGNRTRASQAARLFSGKAGESTKGLYRISAIGRFRGTATDTDSIIAYHEKVSKRALTNAEKKDIRDTTAKRWAKRKEGHVPLLPSELLVAYREAYAASKSAEELLGPKKETYKKEFRERVANAKTLQETTKREFEEAEKEVATAIRDVEKKRGKPLSNKEKLVLSDNVRARRKKRLERQLERLAECTRCGFVACACLGGPRNTDPKVLK